eukprot:4311495-Pyramimonas_sp.AAC.1
MGRSLGMPSQRRVKPWRAQPPQDEALANRGHSYIFKWLAPFRWPPEEEKEDEDKKEDEDEFR